MTDDADRIISLYDGHALAFDKDRSRTLFEKPQLDQFRGLVRRGGSILDIGCGTGEPIARYLIEAGHDLTGIDASPAMIALCSDRFPQVTRTVADMRTLSLGRRFDGVLAWNSFFHLRPADQRKMFSVFQRHAAPNAALMFTSGPRGGEALGSYQGEPLYHASLEPYEYRALLGEHGFAVESYDPENAACSGHTIWLARYCA